MVKESTLKTIKTVLIPIHDGTVSKNLLRTDFLRILKDTDAIRIVLLPAHADLQMYEKEFGQMDKVIIEHSKVYNENDRIEIFFGSIFKHSIPTKFMKIRQVDWYRNQGKYVLYYGTSVLRFLGHSRLWRRFLRVINNLEPIDPKVRAVYEKWKPDIVFAPTMVSRVEVALMRLARRDKKIVIGMPKSFDNLTSKAFLRVHPDVLIVPNETGVKEAVTLYDFPSDRIVVGGICQYDAYVHPEIIEERETFLSKLGLNPQKRTILYAPAGDWMNPTDHEVLAEILKWIDEGIFPNTQVLLRLHPTYESKTEELKGHPNLIVERPGKHFGNLKWYEFEKEDIKHLANSLYHADVVINTASTMMVEGSIFDTPVISLGFDGYKKMDYWHSVVRYYDREHLVPIATSEGVRLVKSFEELKSSLATYFENPQQDTEGRKEVVKRVCYKLDGKSCERTAQVVLDAVASLQ